MTLWNLAVATSLVFSFQSAPPPPQAADAITQRVRTLNDLAAGRAARPANETAGLIRLGLADPDPKVQAAALWALAGRVSAPRFDRTIEPGVEWAAERAVLAAVKADVIGKVTSPNAKVRHAALVALGSFEFDPKNGGRVLRLSPSFVALLVKRYGQEDDLLVRSEIVKALALDRLATNGEATLVAALSDPEPTIVQMASFGIAEHGMLDQLPKLAELLKHPDPDVRSSMAFAFSVFGAAAAGELRALQLSLAGEQEPEVRVALAAAIAAVQRAK